MRIVKIAYIYYGYGTGSQVWFENPKQVWIFFIDRTRRFSWKFYVEKGYLMIKTPYVKSSSPIWVENTILNFLTKKYRKGVRITPFTSRKTKL